MYLESLDQGMEKITLQALIEWIIHSFGCFIMYQEGGIL